MEADFVQWLRRQLGETAVNDDAAVLPLGSEDVVASTDMLMDGTDFELDRIDPRRAGHKACAVNLSDMAAMAAEPIALLVSVALPKAGALQLAQQLYSGILSLAERFQVRVVGGDTNSWDGPLVLNVAVWGRLSDRGPLTRGGARPGDEILVTGSFGGSILGKHLDFEPRVKEALLLHRNYILRGGMDVSDGLSLDLARMAEESGCGVAVEDLAIPISPSARELAIQTGRNPLEHALTDGEDFELILAVDPETSARILTEQPLEIPISRIGHFTHEPGFRRIDQNRHTTSYQPQGYTH